MKTNPVAPLAPSLRGVLFFKNSTLGQFFEENPVPPLAASLRGFYFSKITLLSSCLKKIPRMSLNL